MERFLISSFFILTSLLSLSKGLTGDPTWQPIEYPSVHILSPSKYYFGTHEDVYVKMVAGGSDYWISYVDLYLGKQFIGRENNGPYEWCKPGSSQHHQLRKMPPGVYVITAVIRYVDGKKKKISRKFEVKSPWASASQYDWMTQIKRANPDWKISEYRQGSRRLYKVHSCRQPVSTIYWYDVRGSVVARHHAKSSQGKFSSARLVRCLHNPCR